MKENFNISGMTCSACSTAVEKSVSKLEGVNSVAVNLLTNSMKVDFAEDVVSADKIMSAVHNAGYEASLQTKENKQANSSSQTTNTLEDQLQKEEKSLRFRMVFSLVLMLPLMYIAMAPMLGLPTFSFLSGMQNVLPFALTQMLMTLPILYVNRKYYQSGFKALLRKNPNMDSLVAIGSSAAFIYGIFVIYKLAYAQGHNQIDILHDYAHSLYFESAAMIVALITLGKYLEARSKGKTTSAIKKLMDLSPKTAIRLVNGKEQEVLLEEVKVGDILLVKPGSAVPVDGQILEGNGAFDESAITGESIPVEKTKGDQIIGATLLKLGSVQMRAEKVGDDTAIAKIIQLVQDANATKAPISKLADKISGIFVPTVIGISILTLLAWLLLGQTFEFAFQLAVSVLIISCPCALGLATPVAIMVGTGKGASLGILIKSAEALETLHESKAIVFDKTGTITEGKPRVTDLISSTNYEDLDLLKIAASLESVSEHPLSQAIIDFAKELAIDYPQVKNFYNHLGKGISGDIEGQPYFAGNTKYMKELGLDVSSLSERASKLSDEGKTTLYFANKQNLIGLIAVADQIKTSSKEAIGELHNQGLEVYLLTGDNQKTAQAIANQVGIDKVFAEVLPEEKDQKIMEIQAQGKKVTMVGDGINDAPSLARADVGIAIGAGTDIAIEAADIVLMKSDLADVVNSIGLSRKTITNIKQNLFWAFFYNILCIPLAAGLFYPSFGILLNPMIASAAMSLSSIFVVTNALRLNSFKAFAVGQHKKVMLNINSQAEDPIIEERKKQTMKKTLKIKGMSCGHCTARVEKELLKLDQVQSAKADFNLGEAEIELSGDLEDQVLIDTVTEAGYEVTDIQSKG